MSILFIDVDGTLVDYVGKAPESAVTAIKKARENGHLVFLCTGRSKAEGYDELSQQVGFDGYIGANGGYVEYQEKVIVHHSLSKEECKEVVDWLHHRGLEFFLEGNDGLYGSERFEERGKSAIAMYSKQKGGEEISVREAFPMMKFGENLVREDINKISYILDDYQDFLDTKQRFKNLESNTWGGKGEEALFGDLAIFNIDKGKAVQQVCELLEISLEDSYAFGDAKIDIPMLETCAYGIAMGNGGPEIKAMADYITEDINEDGLEKAFKHFGLI